MRKIFFFLAILSLSLTSCEKEPFLALSIEQISAPSVGNSTVVTVNSNNPWSVTGTDWCTVSPSSGEGGESMVTISVKENTTYNQRNCSLIFVSEGLTASISVYQDKNYGIVLPKNVYEISNSEQHVSVEVRANIDYEVVVDASWIKQVGTKALTSKTYVFKVDENSTYGVREGTIFLKEKNGSVSETIKILQAQKDAIIISSTEYKVTSEAQSLDIKLQSNVELEVCIPENAKSWIIYESTKSLSDKTLVLNIKENEEYDARECQVIIKMKNGMLADTVSIWQAQKDAIMIFQKQYELSNEAHSLEINWQSNVDVDVLISDVAKQWISYVDTKSLSNRTLILDIKQNDTYDVREGNVYLSNVTSGLQDTIKIKQMQKDALVLSQKAFRVKAKGETIEVELYTNVDFEINMPDVDWIHEVNTRALQENKLLFKIDENREDEMRTQIIVVQNVEKQLSDTLIIEQEFVPYVTFIADAKQNLTMTKAIKTLEYSLNGSNWSELGLKTIHFGGDLGNLKIRGKSLIGTAEGVSKGEYATIVFANDVKVACKGDIRTLVDYENYLEANTSEARFYELFRDCSNLISAPDLPATTLATRCYEEMFFGCTSLEVAPELPATQLKANCYHYMFYGCKKLSRASELPAENLAPYCYCYMFYGTNLTETPILPATVLERYCYAGMFMNCKKLNKITMLAMDISAYYCLRGWVEGVPSTGTFIKTAAMKLLPQGPDGVPNWWTVKNYVDD